MLSRKDVKIGLAIGGILLAVVIVYMLSSPGKQGGVELVKSDSTDTSTPAPAPAPDAEASPAQTPAPADSTPVPAKTPQNTATAGTQTQGGGAAPAPESAPAGASAVKSAAAGPDPWATALNTGNLPAMMSATPSGTTSTAATPTDTSASPGASSGASATATPAAQPADATGSGPTTQPAAVAHAADSTAHVHVVQLNETYCTIARAEWGHASLYDKLIQANPGIDPRHLHPGMKINIPARDLAAAPAVSGSAASAAQRSSQGDGDPAASGAAGGGVITPQTTIPQTSAHGTGSAATSTMADMTVGGVAPDGKTYTVQPSDSLYRICKRLYGNGSEANKLYDLNKSVIGPDMAKLKVGMVLKLPESPTATAKAG